MAGPDHHHRPGDHLPRPTCRHPRTGSSPGPTGQCCSPRTEARSSGSPHR